MLTLLVPLATFLGNLDPTPKDEDIKAGYPALFLFLGMLVIIGLLGVSMARHLKKSEANRRAGIFPGSPPDSAERDAGPAPQGR
ncbi:MAG: hypothetical protein LH468_09990 [Nocardioides sp.]|nr:hypothetical protein [Nocardioides sp.]